LLSQKEIGYLEKDGCSPFGSAFRAGLPSQQWRGSLIGKAMLQPGGRTELSGESLSKIPLFAVKCRNPTT